MVFSVSMRVEQHRRGFSGAWRRRAPMELAALVLGLLGLAAPAFAWNDTWPTHAVSH